MNIFMHTTKQICIIIPLTLLFFVDAFAQDDKESRIKTYMTNKVNSESGGSFKLTDFKKTDGYDKNIDGINGYVMEFQMDIMTLQDCYKNGNPIEGYWQNFYVNINPPESSFTSAPMHILAGTQYHFSGDCTVFATERSLRVERVSIKRYRETFSSKIADQSGSTQLQINGTGLNLFSKGDENNIVVEVPKIIDELAEEQMLTKAYFNLINNTKRFSPESFDTIANKTHMQILKSNITTSYPIFSKPTGATYFAAVNISFQLMDKQTEKVLSTYTKRITNSSGYFETSYATKNEALTKLIDDQLANPIWQFLYASFPIKATITDIIDSTRKGEIKKVRINVGTEGGCHKDFAFKLLSLDKDEDKEADVMVTEIFTDYAICKILSNKNYIKESLLKGKKLDIITIYILNDK